jgi:hypothetical protein
MLTKSHSLLPTSCMQKTCHGPTQSMKLVLVSAQWRPPLMGGVVVARAAAMWHQALVAITISDDVVGRQP